ncbi:MAG: FtsK/SpoIIIE domain-containing protein [Collinsella sp.]
MFESAKKLATSSNGHWTIPLQPGLGWNIAQSPHVIVSGSTGSGKSYFTNYLIAMSAIKGCYLILADPKRSDLSAMADFLPEHRVSHDPSGILKLVQSAVEIMTKRYELMNSFGREQGAISKRLFPIWFLPGPARSRRARFSSFGLR